MEPEKRICRYFNTSSGCWYGEKCKFLHIQDKKPPCKFYIATTGCRFGDNCHFSHDRSPFRSMDNFENAGLSGLKEDFKENLSPTELSGTNNNSMELMNPNVNSFIPRAASNVMPNLEGELDPSCAADVNLLPKLCEDLCGTACSLEVNPEVDPTLAVVNSDYRCGSCKRPLLARGNESYYKLLKDHYLECFMEKEGEHVKYVKFKAALDPGQMYWCQRCVLTFEKPWSLFQHMADKATGSRLQRGDKTDHMDWLDKVASLMAAHDLGLFTPAKLRNDLRGLLADQLVMEEEMEAVLCAVATCMQFFPQINSQPWRTQKRDILRQMEQMSRQVLSGGGGGGNGRRSGTVLGGGGGGGSAGSGGSGPIPGSSNPYNHNSRYNHNTGGGSGSYSGRHNYRNSYPSSSGYDRMSSATGYNKASSIGSNNTNSSPTQNVHSSSASRGDEQERGERGEGGINFPMHGNNTSSTSNQASGPAPPGSSNKPDGGSGDSIPDWHCGFSEEEVREMLSHGIRPWDAEAGAALAALRGELDYLL